MYWHTEKKSPCIQFLSSHKCWLCPAEQSARGPFSPSLMIFHTRNPHANSNSAVSTLRWTFSITQSQEPPNTTGTQHHKQLDVAAKSGGAGKHSDSITHEFERKKIPSHDPNKTYSGANPHQIPPGSAALPWCSICKVCGWLPQNEVSFSTWLQHHSPLPQSILGREAISSFGLIAPVCSSKGTQSNSDTYWSPIYWDWNIYVCLLSLFMSIFDFKPTSPQEPQRFSGGLLRSVWQLARF